MAPPGVDDGGLPGRLHAGAHVGLPLRPVRDRRPAARGAHGHQRRRAILGCAALWGRVVEATDGWRGERGYPLVLFAPTTDGGDRRRRDPSLALARFRSSRLPGSRPVGLPVAATTAALGRRYAVPAHPLPAVPRLAVWESDVAGRAAAVRDEAARGLGARRLGDRNADARFSRTVEAMLAALQGR